MRRHPLCSTKTAKATLMKAYAKILSAVSNYRRLTGLTALEGGEMSANAMADSSYLPICTLAAFSEIARRKTGPDTP